MSDPAGAEVASGMNPATTVLIIVGLLCAIIFGGAIFMWFQAQNNGVLDNKKKRKPMSAKKQLRERARETQTGGE